MGRAEEEAKMTITPINPPEPDEGIIAILRDLLLSAESGHISAIVTVTQLSRDEFQYQLRGHPDNFSMLGALWVVADELKDRINSNPL